VVIAPTTPADATTRTLSEQGPGGLNVLGALVDLEACWQYHPGHGNGSAFHERSRALHGSLNRGHW